MFASETSKNISCPLTINMSVCAKCSKPLEVEVDAFDSDAEDEDVEMNQGGQSSEQPTETVPDDVHLSCGDHFHWECLLESYEISKCPACSRDITSNTSSGSSATASNAKILVDLNNEGGLQQQIDIFPILQEESYLRAYPEERKSRAFLEFCREGDHRAIVDLLKSCTQTPDDPVDGEDMETDFTGSSKSPDEILRYQDPIGDMQSGLHAAAANGHREVAWLLLLLASNYPELEFPALVFQEAATMGIMREDQAGKADIRTLKDAHGRTAEDVAKETGVIWNGWIGNGRLAMT